jgi:hypothetical protein|tara:strand:+ start:73 stop:831 length:759 start_codon:yes stop_codon:yes gene_type:complete
MSESHKLSKKDIEEIKILRKQGMSGPKIAVKFGVAKAAVYYHTTPGLKERSNLCSKKNEHKYTEARKKYKAQPEYLEKQKVSSSKRRDTFDGRMAALYQGMKRRNNKFLKLGDSRGVNHFMTKESWNNLVQDYIEKYGFVDFYYRTPLTAKAKQKNTVSVDRLDNNKGYIKNNVVLASWEVNDRKNAVTIQDCLIFVTRYLEVEHPVELKLLSSLPGKIGDLFRTHLKTNVIDNLKIETKERVSFSNGGIVG